MSSMTPISTALFLTFRSLNRYYHLFAQRYGVASAQLAALQKLWVEDGLTISELAERMGLDLSTTTGLVDRLEKGGLARRQRESADRRVVRVWLTDRGKNLRERVPSFSEEVEALLARRLTAQEREVLVTTLFAVREVLDEELDRQSAQGKEGSSAAVESGSGNG